MELNGQAGVGEPVHAAVLGLALVQVVIQIIGVLGVDIPRPGLSHRTAQPVAGGLVSVIRPGNADAPVLDLDRMAGHVADGLVGHVIEPVLGLFHRQIARAANLGLLDHHILILPVHHVAGARRDGDGCLVRLGAQDAHFDIDVIPVVAHEMAEVFLAPVIVRNHNFVIELLLHGSITVHLLPGPREDQFQIGFLVVPLIGSVGPGLRIHVHGIGVVIIAGLLHQRLDAVRNAVAHPFGKMPAGR